MIHKATAHLLKHKAYDIAIIALITLAATSKWLNAGIPTGHDAVGDMLLAQAASSSFSVHHLVAGWISNWSMGYPLFYVHPPLVSCLIWAFSYLLGWILAAKLLYISFFVLSGVFAYLYVSELTRNRCASFAAGLAYVFLPYHIIEVGFEGHHGAFGMPYMLTPLILLCLERLVQNPGLKYTIISGVLLALLTLTYPQVFPFLFGPFLILYVILRIWWERQRGAEYLKNIVITSLATLCLALLLTAFWWLPLPSEMRNFHATSFPIEASRESSATFLQAITLRPGLCCSPSSAYGSAGSISLEILRMFPFALVLLGMILNRNNKHVWFFSVSILIGVLLAMGPDSPMNLFGVAHRYVPFFTGLRTPARFLLFTSIAYAVLIGFCVNSIVERLGHIPPRESRHLSLLLLIPVLVSLIVVSNTWQETRTAFGTFTLPVDQQKAFDWLGDTEGGDYRIANPPFDPYVRNDKDGYIIDPTTWTYLHGKENVYGSAVGVEYTLTTLESLNTDLERGPFDMSQWLNIFNVKYVLLDKTNPLSSNVILDAGFEQVWTSDTLDIFENHAFKPRMFSITNSDAREISLYSGTDVHLSYVEGTQEAVLSLSDEHTLSCAPSLMSAYSFSSPNDYACLEADVRSTAFHDNDAIHLVYYSERDIPDVHLSLELIETDGSRYDVVLGAVDGLKEGWNEINFPLSLLTLRYSTDENAQLDVDQIDRLWIGAGRQGNSHKSEEFALYFDTLSIVTQEANTDVEYTKIRPGKYKVHVTSDSPTCLVLSESYHPNWVARVNGKTVHSQLIYQALNGFYLEAGEHDITLEFVTSPLRIAGNVISGVTWCALCLLGVLLLLRIWHERRRRQQHLLDSGEPQCS